MTSSKPPRGTQDPPAMGADEVRRLLADIDALEAHSSPPEHDPPPGAVGEFAYSWFTQGAEQARRNFADVALHVALGYLDVSLTSFAFDYRPDTSVLREQPIQMVDALVLQAERAMPNASAMWGAALGSSRAPAPRRMPRALLEVVARSRAACQECAEIIHDTFQMALDDGDAMHRSNMDPPRPVAPRRRIDAATAADVLPSGWGVPAAPMPSFAMAMSAPPPFDDDEATVPFSHMYCIGASTLSLLPGDLTRSSAEVLVSSDDDTLAMGGGVSRALLRASSIEVNKLEKRVPFLATTASITPFIGLFGTVWGIMTAFMNIGAQGSTDLAVVSTPIAEALIATALGLFAAIPAVYFYNHFTSKVKTYASEMDDFALEFLNISERNFT